MPNKKVHQVKKRELSYAAAIREAFDIALARDHGVFLIGEGIPDPKGAFGTTTGLQQKFGLNRVMDMPLSENGLTGVCIGAALAGMRPILTHMRIDFSLLSMDQIVNTAAKWFYMFGGKKSVPLVIRMIIGRGWGQGPQHSQSLQALFAHIPGLKIVMPSFPQDAKGLLLRAIADNNPVIYIEHRWLHSIVGDVAKGYYTIPIGKCNVVEKGSDLTLVSTSYMTIESLKAWKIAREAGVSIELIDVRTIKPFGQKTVIDSVAKTGRLLVADTGHATLGFASEVISCVSQAGVMQRCPPQRITLPDLPTPTSWKLSEQYYPTYQNIARVALEMVGVRKNIIDRLIDSHAPPKAVRSDQPDSSFTGPF